MKASLSDKLLRALIATGRPHEPIWEPKLRGFGIRVGDHGGISFFACRRLRGGGRAPIRITLGHYPSLPLAEARERARQVLRELEDGIDPRRREAEQAQARAAQAEAETADQEKRFGAVAEQFIRRHVASKRTANAIALRIRRELISRWADKPITEVSRADVVRLIDQIVDRGHVEAARQTFVYGRRLFGWAIGRNILEHSPFDHLNTRDLIGVKKIRQRLLTASELALIWRAAADGRYPDDPYIKLLLLLGPRRSELGQATWDEFDLDQALWIIGPQRMKSDEGHSVPLPPRAVEILRGLPRFASGYVFTARGDKPLNDYGEIKRRLDLRITELNGGTPIQPWTLHDARRVFRTGLSTLNVPPHVAELCLAHRQPGLARTYDLHRFDLEKRNALNAWAAYLLDVVEPSPGGVVRLRSRRGSATIAG